MKNRKPPAESEIAEWLRKDQLELPPLHFKLKQQQPSFNNNQSQWDYAIEAQWKDQTAKFVVESKTLSTPKVFDESLRFCKSEMVPRGYRPLILMPYLRPSQLDELERNEISGVDWCGNGVVIVPNKLRVFRTGNHNQFATYSPIKNIYRKNTSMVARALLTEVSFSTVQTLMSEINSRNPFAAAEGGTPMTMGTVSKALKQLENELIVDRSTGVRVLQPRKLLENLRLNYEPPKETNRVRLKVECDFEQLPRMLAESLDCRLTPVVATGLSSVSNYAVMQREAILSLYCPRIAQVQSKLNSKESDRFYNLEIIETSDQPCYFDAWIEDGFLWASPVQTYLELMRGDKRDLETAEQVESYLLSRLGEKH